MMAALRQRLAPLTARWRALDPRQQWLSLGAATLLSLLLIVAYVWLPAQRERERLQARLPLLRAQLTEMQRQVQELRELSTAPTIASKPVNADLPALQALFGESAVVSVTPARSFRVVLPKIAYATWWDRMNEAEARFRLHLVTLKLTALPGGGREVAVDMQLAETGASGPAAAAPAAASRP